MPNVSIRMIEGRDIDVKRSMVKDITEAICKNVGCPPQAVSIDISEYKTENLAQAGELFVDSHH